MQTAMTRYAFIVAQSLLASLVISYQQIAAHECPTDFLVIIDNSGSVKSVFDQEKRIAAQLVDALDVSVENTRVALVQFNEVAHSVFSFSTFNRKEDVVKNINELEAIGGQTNTEEALQMANADFQKFARSHVNKIILLVTDGHSQNTLESLQEATKALVNEGIIIFAATASDVPGILEFMIYTSAHSERIFLRGNITALVPQVTQTISTGACLSQPSPPSQSNNEINDVDTDDDVDVRKRQAGYGAPAPPPPEPSPLTPAAYLQPPAQPVPGYAPPPVVVDSTPTKPPTTTLATTPTTMATTTTQPPTTTTTPPPTTTVTATTRATTQRTTTTEAVAYPAPATTTTVSYETPPTVKPPPTIPPYVPPPTTTTVAPPPTYAPAPSPTSATAPPTTQPTQPPTTTQAPTAPPTTQPTTILTAPPTHVPPPLTTVNNGGYPTPPTMQTPATAPPSVDCSQLHADVVFLVDQSSSIGKDDFQNQVLSFIRSFVESLDIGASRSRIGMLSFSHLLNWNFKLNSFDNKQELLDAISHVTYMTGRTLTGAALQEMASVGFSKLAGVRNRAPRIGIVITDGRAQDNVIVPAQAARNAGIKMVAIGVTDHVLQSELLEIAGSNDMVFLASDFGALNTGEILESLKKATCNAEALYCPPENDCGQHSGCVPLSATSYTCKCLDGFDDKSPDPSKPGRVCDAAKCDPSNFGCSANSECVQAPSGTTCRCRPGFVDTAGDGERTGVNCVIPTQKPVTPTVPSVCTGPSCECTATQRRPNKVATCEDVIAFNFLLNVIRRGDVYLHWAPIYVEPTDETRKNIFELFKIGIKTAFDGTVVAPAFVDSEIIRILNPKDFDGLSDGLVFNFTVYVKKNSGLTPQVTWNELWQNIVSNTYQIGDTDLYANKLQPKQPHENCTPACKAGEVCENGKCVPEKCSPACKEGELCVGGKCVPEKCTTACKEGEICINGNCVPEKCTPACKEGERCVGGKCISQCSQVCNIDLGEVCINGTCACPPNLQRAWPGGPGDPCEKRCEQKCNETLNEICINGKCDCPASKERASPDKPCTDRCTPSCNDKLGQICVNMKCVCRYDRPDCLTAKCKPACDAGLGEVCVNASCTCPPSKHRFLPTDSCQEAVATSLQLIVVRKSDEILYFNNSFIDTTDPIYGAIVRLFKLGIGESYGMSPLAPGYLGVEVNSIDNSTLGKPPWPRGLLFKFTIYTKPGSGTPDDIVKALWNAIVQRYYHVGFTPLIVADLLPTDGIPVNISIVVIKNGTDVLKFNQSYIDLTGPDYIRFVDLFNFGVLTQLNRTAFGPCLLVSKVNNIAQPNGNPSYPNGLLVNFTVYIRKVSGCNPDITEDILIKGIHGNNNLIGQTLLLIDYGVIICADGKTFCNASLGEICDNNGGCVCPLGTTKPDIPGSACTKIIFPSNPNTTDTFLVPLNIIRENKTGLVWIDGLNKPDFPEAKRLTDLFSIAIKNVYGNTTLQPFFVDAFLNIIEKPDAYASQLGGNVSGLIFNYTVLMQRGKVVNPSLIWTEMRRIVDGNNFEVDHSQLFINPNQKNPFSGGCSNVLCPTNTTCTIVNGVPTCVCLPGFDNVTRSTFYANLKALGVNQCMNMSDIRYCEWGLTDCSPVAICTNLPAAPWYSCQCPAGVKDGDPEHPGRVCPAKEVIGCEKCHGNGDCVSDPSAPDKIVCKCHTWYAGEFCTTDLRAVVAIVLAILFLLLCLCCCLYWCLRCRCLRRSARGIGAESLSAMGSQSPLTGREDYYKMTIPRAKLAAAPVGEDELARQRRAMEGYLEDGAGAGAGGGMRRARRWSGESESSEEYSVEGSDYFETTERKVTTDVSRMEYTKTGGGASAATAQFRVFPPMITSASSAAGGAEGYSSSTTAGYGAGYSESGAFASASERDRSMEQIAAAEGFDNVITEDLGSDASSEIEQTESYDRKVLVENTRRRIPDPRKS